MTRLINTAITSLASFLIMFSCALPAKAINLTTKLTAVGTNAGFQNASSNLLAQQTGQVINAVLSLLGVIFMAYVIYGGYLWIIARGNDEQITKAKAILRGSIIGLAIVLAAYAITAFVVSRLISATGYAG